MRKLKLLTDMKSYCAQLEKERMELDSKPRINGFLRVSNSSSRKHRSFYYRSSKSELGGEYLTKDQLPFIKALAQQEYEKEVAQVMEEMEKALKKCIRSLEKIGTPDDVFNNLNPARKDLVEKVKLK